MQPSVSQPLASKLNAVFLQHHSILTQKDMYCKGFKCFFEVISMKMFSFHFTEYFMGNLLFLYNLTFQNKRKPPKTGGFQEIIMKKFKDF